MPLSTLGVAADVTPSVIETFFSHYINRRPLRQKPTAHISYHEGLRVIREFLNYASQHTVDDVQAFTAQWVPCPTWVTLEEVLIPQLFLSKSASIVESQLGPGGIELVGGKEWWQWRRPEAPFKAEWIEMKADTLERKAEGREKSERNILYVHGGAYYFGSTGEHRYQMQRHARKLKARLFAPKYRLAPQFPFPCGLYDCIAAYLYLIQDHDPSTVLLGGDSAGGGMVMAMLITLRDQGIPLPAGAILLSPWVDLTHSFPSLAGDGKYDYIPANGFHHKPSMAWPPPNADDLEKLKSGIPTKDDSNPHPTPKPGKLLSIELDGKLIELKDQIQMYAPNHLLAHPMVSPVMQPSLGGLPPLLIQTGGGELLHDEQVYLAHKAANPTEYPPPDTVRRDFDPDQHILHKYPPTMVQLQVWDDLCHVPHTLSFTRPAKYMYRSVAQFGAWALAHAQSRPVTILDDDEISIISSDSRSERSVKIKTDETDAQINMDGEGAPRSANAVPMRAHTITTSSGIVGKAGDPLPPFTDHMIRQRVDRHGLIYPLPPASELPALHVPRNEIGMIKPGPVRKWLAKQLEWDTRFGKEKRQIQKTRLKEMKAGYDEFIGETPPPTALAGRRHKKMEKQKERKGKSWALAMWTGWGSKHDEVTIDRKKTIGRRATQTIALPEAGEGIAATKKVSQELQRVNTVRSVQSVNPAAGQSSLKDRKVEGSENTYLSENNARPHNGVISYPFKLRNMPTASLSTATLDSGDHIRPMGAVEEGSLYESSKAPSKLKDDGGSDSESSMKARSPPRSWVDGSAEEQKTIQEEKATEGEGNEIGGHNWIMGDQKKERPALETFVTAREDL